MSKRREQPRGRWAALRDLLLISLAVVALVWAGAVTNGYEAFHDAIRQRFRGTDDEILGALLLTAAGLAVFAARQWYAGRRESTARRAAEGRFRALVEKLPGVIYTWDPRRPLGAAVTPYVSPQIEQVLGFTVDEWMSDPQLWIRQIHPDDRDRVIEASERSDRSGQPLAIEYRHVKKDGKVVWVRDEAIVVERDVDGRPSLAQGVMYDISERKRAEQDLAETEARYRTLVERVPAVTYTWNTVNRSGDAPASYISPQVRALLGYAPEEFADPTLWSRLVHPEDLDRVMAEWDACQRGDVAFRSEYRMSNRDGQVVWVRDEAVPVSRDDKGNALFQGVMLDVTERKLAEERLLEAEERFRTLVEQIPAITYIEDPETGRNLYISPQIEAVLGYSDKEWMADPSLWERTLHPADRDRVIAGNAQDLGDEWSVSYRSIARDGRVVWLQNYAILIRDAAGKPRFWQGVTFDITELKEAEGRIAEAESTYRTLVEQLPVVVYQDAVDDMSTALYISPQYERLFGYPPEARLSDPGFWIDHLHPEDRERVLELSRWTNETGEPFSAEYRFQARDERYVWVRDEAVLQREPDGRPLMWQGVLIDITARKQAEFALSRRDDMLEAIGFAAERLLKSSSWHDVLDEVLERFGVAARASRAYLFSNRRDTDDRLLMSLETEWVAPGVAPTAHNPANKDYPYERGFSWWVTEMEAGNVVQVTLSQAQGEERTEMEVEAIKSLVAVPVVANDEWWGFLGLDDCEEERLWSVAEIEALKTAADTLGAAIGRSRAEAQRTEAETRYRTLVEAIPAVIYIQDAGAKGRITYVSPQIEAMLGYTVEEWRARRGIWLESVHPEDRERVLAADAQSDRTGEPFSVEYRQRHNEGHWVWVHDQAVLVYGEDGEPSFWQGLRFDITARKQAERQMHEAQQRYQGLVENLPAATYIDLIDERSTTLYVSPQVESLFGYSQDEWIRDPDVWIDALHPEDRDAILAAVDRHNNGGEPFEVEYRMRTKDGRWVWVSDHATVVRDEDGLIAFSQGVMFDVTERRKAEEQLRETEERYRAIVEHVPAAIYVDRADETMQSIYVSPQIEQLTGWTPEEYLSNPELWLDRMREDYREEIRRSYVDAIGNGLSWKAEYPIITPDDREVWIHDETSFVHDDEGNPLFLQGVLYDITERKLAEHALAESEQREREAAERLRALDEMKNTFLAAVSHELRSPLTSILGLALTLEQQSLPADEQTDLMGRLAANARKLDGLLKDLLDIDRLSRGIVTPKVRPTDIGAVVERTVGSLDVFGERSILLQTESVVVPADPPKIERIVENLVMNAVRHTEGDVGIWVRVFEQDGGAVIAVEDDGPGVPADLQSEIFEAFRQGPTVSAHSPGTGIGLSLVAMFADLHGGRAWVQDREGGGASFRVYLPGGAPNGKPDGSVNGRAAAAVERASAD